ncbi:unnamed protein product [Closterium sp. Naga37s-1]|nr:unnamed protein product [Closterium sp. Naga37s-1]
MPGVCTLLGSLSGLNTINGNTSVQASYVGGQCNPLANTKGDPHFRGADGTRFDFNGLLDRSFCLLSDRRILINMGIKGYRPIANLRGTATSLDENTLAAAVEAAANEFKPRHIQELQEEALNAEEVAELLQMRANGSLPESAKVTAALERGSFTKAARAEMMGARLERLGMSLQRVALRKSRIRSSTELQVMWRDDTGAQHSAFLKARDGKEQGRGATGFTQRMHTEGIHGVLGQTFRGEASRAVRSLRHRLLTRLLREPVDVESSEGGDGLLDGRVQDYLTSGIAAPDCAFAAAWRRGEQESEMGDDGLDPMR